MQFTHDTLNACFQRGPQTFQLKCALRPQGREFAALGDGIDAVRSELHP
jgi:hypothetical protein